MPDFPPLDSHNVWLATSFQVEAANLEEATQRTQIWLAALLDQSPLPRGEGVAVNCSAVSFDAVATLALQLLALEKRGGAGAACLTQLRAEVSQHQQEEARQRVAKLHADIENRTTTSEPTQF